MDALFDTDCLAGDFVARRIVDKYNIKPILESTAKLSVCSGLDSTCYGILKPVIISVNYLNERLNNINTFDIKAIILDTSPLDLIIGRATIQISEKCLSRRLQPLSTRLSAVAVSRRRSSKPLEASQKVPL